MSLRRKGQRDVKKTISSIDDLQYLDVKHLVRDGPRPLVSSRGNDCRCEEHTTWALDGLLFALIVFHIVVAPYTKVEESFNLQATHDLLNFGFEPTPLSLLDRSTITRYFDHLEFPGVVPRTFVGPLLLATTSWPFLKLADLISPVAAGVAFTKGLRAQIIVRLVLGAYTFFCWRVLRKAVQRQFGARAAQLFMFVSACQFHCLFYAGRTLPNIFALGLVNVAYSYWLRASTPEEDDESSSSRSSPLISPTSITPMSEEGARALGLPSSYNGGNGAAGAGAGAGGVRALTRQEIEMRLCRMIDWFVVATVLFRSELVLLLGPILLVELITTRISFQAMVIEGLLAGTGTLLVGLAVDSWFWQQPWMWAEVLGLALPMGLAAFWVEPRFRRYLVPTGVFVGAYSALGHKEWRFVVYVVPILNLGAALFLDWCWKRGLKRRAHHRRAQKIKAVVCKTVAVLAVLALGVCLGVALGMSLVSSTNYPGGHALARLHALVAPSVQEQQPQGGVGETAATTTTTVVHVHIDGLAAETGCSRFGELYAQKRGEDEDKTGSSAVRWIYSKREGLKDPQEYVDAGFTHLLTSEPELHKDNYEVIEVVQGFSGLKFTRANGGVQAVMETCRDYVKIMFSELSWSLAVERAVGMLKACGVQTKDSIWIMRRRA
ncbi:dolichyl-P-Man:Man(7)GlcNAc(2)-PP-dolichol alpha-1,6-mannosyltransferase [Actinomortierella ambigua]|nr:dolichyl-P-Man:Man(7)GlcNAc(2)-PP-dolichol alpha-1,6-mannosyltransferase [Actinomortierella ambigua]